MVYSPTWIPDSDSHNPALLDLLLSSNASICSTMAFHREIQIMVLSQVFIDFQNEMPRFMA